MFERKKSVRIISSILIAGWCYLIYYMSCASIVEYILLSKITSDISPLEGLIYSIIGLTAYNLAYETGSRKVIHIVNNVLLFVIPSIVALIGALIPSSHYDVGDNWIAGFVLACVMICYMFTWIACGIGILLYNLCVLISYIKRKNE